MTPRKKKFKSYNINLIKNLRISISVKQNITYWAFVDTKWKRIAKKYYDTLVDSGIKITLKNVAMINEKDCKVDLTNKTKELKKITNIIKDSEISHKKVANKVIEKSTTKKQLGQFYSINCNYILQGMYIPKSTQLIIEPFGGCGSLIQWINQKTDITVESYDVSPKLNVIIKRDVFKDIPVYKDKFIITNPPYLSKNKTQEKKNFDFYKTDDLYKCFIIQLLDDVCLGGILIVPLNFFCSFRKKDLNLRKRFLDLYDIILINIFEEPVFSDTSYTVCSFMFKKKINFLETSTKICMYPSKVRFSATLNNKNFYSFNANIFNLPKSKLFTIKRVTKFNCFSEYTTNIIVQCIDNKINKINASIVNTESIYRDITKNASTRSYLSLWIKPKISLELQKKLVILFNSFIREKRKKYFSLFLSQYRELDRKRISFKLVYDIFRHLFKIYIENEHCRY